MDSRHFFNSMALKWDIICNHDENKINHILDLIGVKNQDKVLDVGTGTGILLPFLLERIGQSGEIVGIDIAEKMLEIAKKKNPSKNIRFICADILDVELQEEYFDVIICYSAFPHFKDQQRAVSNMSRCLKDMGVLCICHSQSRDAINSLHKKSSDKIISRDHLPEMDIMKRYFSNAGLEVIKQIDNEEMFVILGRK